MNTKKTILVADDDKNICELIRLYLEKEGFGVVCVYDGNMAVQNVLHSNFDAVILDIMMPKTDGIEALKTIRKVANDYYRGNPLKFKN